MSYCSFIGKTKFLLVAAILSLGTLACSSTDDSEKPNPKPSTKSVWKPIAPPFSPPDQGGYIVDNAPASGKVRGRQGSSSSGLTLWFYLVNGDGLSENTDDTILNALTVNGPAPVMSTSPNGGMTVGVEELSSSTATLATWKAVPTSDGASSFFLRSGVSFEVNNNGTYPMPNLLVGYGADFAPFDLGYVSQWSSSAAIYWNQSLAPNGDQSQFQQWTYDTGTAQLTVGGQTLHFTGSNGATAFGDDTSAPNNQWFAYPNYELLRIVNEPNSDPPFPAFPFPAPTDCGSSDSSLGDSAGEQAAYDYLSDLYLTGVQQNCTYEGTDYTGIRCEYTNLSGTSTLNTCASTSLSYYGDSDSNPGSYNGVTISDTDWQAVTCQLYLECQYAADVQTTFNYYNEIIDAVFISDSDLVTSLADDLGLSVSESVNATALDVIQGVVQTVVWGAGGLGGAAAGVASAAFAEFLSTTTAVASDSNDC